VPTTAYRLLVVLVLLCLIPRAAMALRIPSICPDGVLYVRLAESIEHGNFLASTEDMSLNTYPFILAGLHRMGLDWELAAALWGVTISSLVVLPLWGWARRQFDDRVALAACLLYIVNPKMIEWSPEVMRDQTFWFLFMLAIYWLWLAVTEVRYVWFIAGGAAFTLAALTRFEGLFLIVPMVLWTFWRHRALQTLSVGLFPTLLMLASLLLAGGHAGFASSHITRVARILPWLESLFHRASATIGNSLEKPMSAGQMIWVFIPTMSRGLSPVFALLLFGGLWGWRREWSRRDHQPLFYATVVAMCGIWVQLWCDKTICPRYALPIVLMGAPFAALGLLGMFARLRGIVGRLKWNRRSQTALTSVAAVLVVVLSLTDTVIGTAMYFETRQMAADLGHWTKTRFPDSPMLLGPVGITPIVSYYADGIPYHAFRWETNDAMIVAISGNSRAGIVLLQPAKELTRERCDALADQLQHAGLRLLGRDDLPPTCRNLRVLVRTDRVASEPKRAY
jgi:hypothetical protein